MTNFFMLPEYLQYTVIFVNLIALVINIYSVVSCVIFEAHNKRIGINLMLTGLNTALFYMFVSVNFANRKSIKGHSFLFELFSKYGWAFMALLSMLSVLSALSLYLVEKWKREHITPASIKEGIDRLPAGLCYHNEKVCRGLSTTVWTVFADILRGNRFLTVTSYGEDLLRARCFREIPW